MKRFYKLLLLCLLVITGGNNLKANAADTAYQYAVIDTEAGTVTIDGTLGGKTEATEDDVNALVEAIQNYADSGITTIIVTGSEPALIYIDYIDSYMPAVSEALYRLTDGLYGDSPYCGTIDLILPDVTEIVDDEFNNTYALNSITLPKVTSVGDGAFYATIYLQKLTFGSVITFVKEESSGPFHMDGYKVGGCDLILNCGQLQAEDKYKPNFETNVWFIGDWSGEYEWKSITLTHNGGEATCTEKAVCETCGASYGELGGHSTTAEGDRAATCKELAYCSVCKSEYGEVNPANHTPAEDATYTDNGDGTHSFTCSGCNETVPENHDFGSGNTCICGAEIAFTGIVVDDENSDEYRYDETSKTYTIIIPADEVGGTGYLSYDIIGTNLTLIEDTNTLLKVQHENEDGLTPAPDDLLVDVLQDNGYFGWSVLGYGDGEWEKLLYSNDGGMTWTTYTFEVKQAYSITVNASQNGTVTANEYAIEGDNIALNVSPAEGYMLDTLSVTDASGNTIVVENNQFTMPASAVTVNATFAVCDHKDSQHETAVDSDDGTHSFTCTVCGGTGTEDHTLTYTASGNVITATCSANCGYTGTATITAANTTYNGTEQKTATVTYSEGWTGGELTVSYENNVNAGTATASITLGEATASVEFTIAKAEVDFHTFIDPEFAEGLVYDGTEKALVTAHGSVEGGTIVFSLVPKGEYTTTIPVATEAGEYVVYYFIRGDENHQDLGAPGEAYCTVYIEAKLVTDATVTLGEYDSIYNGTAKEPGVASVVVDGRTLVEGTDYTVSYENNVYVGTATVIITFKGNYTGSVTVTFEITQDTITSVPAPENLVAEATSTSSIALTWNKVQHALSYNIYQNEEMIANVADTNYVAENLDYNTEHCFSVTSVRYEKESEKSEKVCVKTLDLPISTPENLVAEATSTSSITLTWNEVENALSYNVYRDNEFIANVNETNYSANNLDYYTEYCFSVTAVRNEQESENSNSDCAKTFDLPITAPEVYGEAIDEHSIMLSWDPVENAMSYNIYGLGTVTNITDTYYIVENLEPNTDYCFEVSTVRNNTEIRTPYEICVMTFDLPITTPENLVATAISTSEITLTWDEVENALSYNVYRDNEFIANVTENNYSSNNLDYYTEYCFTVTAVRNEQESESSDSDCAKTFDLPITAPEVYGEAIDEYSIMLSWDPVDNAISYNIYGFGTVFNITDTIYIVENLEPNTDYCFEVSTVRNNTEVRTPYEICVMTFDLPISTPENLVATAISTSEITLTWNEVENALNYNVYQNNNFIANVNDNNYSANNLDYYTEYCFSVTAVRNEQESENSNSDCAKTFDLPITTPENLVATAISTSEITLIWDEVENALSYNVYLNNNFIANVNDNNYSANNLDYYTEYCFSVTAIRNEQESENSNSDCAKTFDLPISTPENLVAEATSTSEITLTWDEVENALSYNVYQNNNFIANVNDNNYSVNNLDYYTEYCFSVTAVRNEQESESSNSDCAKTFDLPITTPENLVATAISTSEITLTWNEVENALSYNVYRDDEFIANVNETNYSANNLDYYTEYCFTVTAVRNEQESENSNSDCAKTFDLPITTPENLVATAISTSEISLTWNEVENALSYNVYQNNNFIANVNDNNYSVNNLDYYTEYCFSVTAVRNEQESESSDSDCAKTFDLPITTPENLVATAISTSEITLTWDEVENALSYNVYQNNNFIANVNDNNYSVNNLDYYTEYCFTVTAVRNEQESESSNSDCAKTFDLPITTPENLVATAISTSEITLTWDEVENALSYNVYRDDEFVANVNETNYSANNLDYYTEYCFSVTAVRNEQESESSDSDCAKTFDLPITTPENLVATAISTSEISLTWNEVENALSYNVYRDNEFIANVTENNYSDEELEYNTEYCYSVTAVRNEQESENSNSDCAKTFDLPITTPENLVATAISTSEITLTWDEVENALSYNVYRDNEFIANVTENNYSDEELEYNTEYCYSVTAVRNEQESEFSEKVCIKTLGEGIEELTSSYRLYPNPAKDKLYIITDDYEYVEEISVYTLSGVLIYKEIDFNNKSIDVSNMVSGVYFIKIKTENETFVQKFIKE